MPGGVVPVAGYKEKIGTSTRHSVRCMEYDVVSFVDQCVEAYVVFAGIHLTKLSPRAQTPFLEETNAFTKDMPEELLSNIGLGGPHENAISRPIL